MHQVDNYRHVGCYSVHRSNKNIAAAEDGDEWDVTANMQAALETVIVVEASGDES